MDGGTKIDFLISDLVKNKNLVILLVCHTLVIYPLNKNIQWKGLTKIFLFRSRGSAKGKDSEYENMESDVPDEEEKVPGMLNVSRDSEQREIDEFEEEERRLLAEEEKVKVQNKNDMGLIFLFLIF